MFTQLLTALGIPPNDFTTAVLRQQEEKCLQRQQYKLQNPKAKGELKLKRRMQSIKWGGKKKKKAKKKNVKEEYKHKKHCGRKRRPRR